MYKKILFSLSFLLSLTSIYAASKDTVYFTVGFKVGEVSSSSAILWTRLCKYPKAVAIRHERDMTTDKRTPIDFDQDMPIAEMDGAVVGTMGQVKVILESNESRIEKDWKYVSSFHDYIYKEPITGLSPNTTYKVTIQGRKSTSSSAPITEIKGSFTTAPSPKQAVAVTFTSSTCQAFWSYDDPVRGFKGYDSMHKLKPLFHFQTGDYVYYDRAGPYARNVALARHKWNAVNSWASLNNFYNHTPLYLLKDDHDLLRDDATPKKPPYGELSFEDGLLLWNEQAPIMGKSYRTVRWGKDLEIWVVEGRDFRSENTMPDGKDKSIWGKEQIVWFKKSVKASNATFKIVCSPTPIVGPDRAKLKFDNHANKSFQTEGDWLRKYLADNDMYVINGDRHWQYVSKDIKTGLMEFSQGPISDSHAQGWGKDDLRPEHQFLRVEGGFLAVNVYRDGKTPVIEFVHHDVNGKEVNKVVIRK